MAQERGMTIDEFNKLGEDESFTDTEVDEYQKNLGEKKDDLIMDGRLSWYFIPKSLKVFLDVDAKEAAKRIYQAAKEGLREDEKPFASVEEVETRVEARVQSDTKRYQKYYGVDYLNRDNYDLIIDTTDLSPDQIVSMILTEMKK